MKRFRFGLERVLELRHRAEQERAQAVARALREEEERRRALAEAQQRLALSGEQIADNAQGVANAGTLRNLGLALHAAARAMDAAAEEHAEAVESVEQEQALFGEARRDRRVVERLREQQQELWTQELARHEQRETDEVARDRHTRRKPSW